MKRTSSRFRDLAYPLSVRILVVLLALFALCPAQGAKHVVLISIDGFAAYHLNNRALELPNIRALAKQGVWYGSSETVFPSVTHPSHTTIVTGVSPRRHGVLSNSMTNRETGENFHPTNKVRTDIVKVPTLFDAAKQKGLKTAAFFWPETKDDPSVDFNVPEVFTPESKGDIKAVSPAILDELRKAGVGIDLYFERYGSELAGAADVVLAEAASYAIERHKPNLLAIHLLVTDKTQHAYGPHHYKSQWALSRADYCVGLLREAARKAGIEDETVFIVTADHGFHSVYQEMNIRPAFAEAGLLGKVKLEGGGWTVSVVLPEGFADEAALDGVFDRLRDHPNIARIVSQEEIHELGQPRFVESPYAYGHYLIIPDIDTHLVVDSSTSTMERRPKKKPSHGHGYLPSHPRMYPSLVLAGDGVKKAVTLPHARNLDIAPTIAKLLGLEMPDVEGSPLNEALETK